MIDWRHILMVEIVLLAFVSWRWVMLKAPRSDR